MKTLFVMRLEGNEDFVRVFTSLKKALETGAEIAAEDYGVYFENENAVANAKARMKEGYTYLHPDEWDEIGMTLIAAEME